jgi:uncharacterized cupredoxin-like copper-binding protein
MLRAVFALVLLVGLGACGAGSQGGNQPQPSPGEDEILVKGLDTLRFEPAELAVRAGRHTIVFQNVGKTLHQLAVSEEGEHGDGDHALGDTGEVEGGETVSFEVDLKPGTYEFACHVLGHYEAGMKGTLTVS